MNETIKPIPIEKRPEIKISVTVVLRDEFAGLWHDYAQHHQAFDPSNGQIALALMMKGLESWRADKRAAERQGVKPMIKP